MLKAGEAQETGIRIQTVPAPRGRVIALSDVHGHARYLRGVLEKLRPAADDALVIVGDLLEKLFAALTHAEHRVRKGFLLAPVCPVYGLAMCAVLALGADRIGPLWELALLCSITATTAEYAVHLFCDAVLGVRFWDYSATKTDVNGRICLPFSLAWGVLGALAVRLVQPALAALAAGIPSAVTNTVLLCLGIDALWSTGVLLRWGDIDLLAPSRLRRKYRTA